MPDFSLSISILRSQELYAHIGGKEDEHWLLKEVLPYTEQYL